MKNFASMFFSEIGLEFFAVSLSGFGIRVVFVSYNECGSVPSPSILRNSLRSVGVSSYRVWQDLAGNSSGSVFLLADFH